jgi:hypothetical protein
MIELNAAALHAMHARARARGLLLTSIQGSTIPLLPQRA